MFQRAGEHRGGRIGVVRETLAITAYATGDFALALRELRTPDVGGPYAFSRHGFGDFVGFQAAWTYWIGAWVGVGAIASSMVAPAPEISLKPSAVYICSI